MKKLVLTSLILLLALASAEGAQQPSGEQMNFFFGRYQTADGMPNNSVYCTVQDKEGFLWIGTRDGICRYDGYTFTRMGDTESRKAMSGKAEALFIDRKGTLWFSTAYGRGSYNPRTGEVTTVSISTDFPVKQIIQDAEGDIWFCSNDLFRYDTATEETTRFPSNGFRFICAASDSNGQIWCTCSDGRFLRYDSLVGKFKEEDVSGLELIAPVSGKRILACTTLGEVMILNAYTGTSEPLFKMPDNTDDNKVTSMVERVPGEFWIGSGRGIHIYKEGVGLYSHLVHSDSESMSLSSNSILCLSSDREGNIWAGTGYEGLNLWRNNNSAYCLFYPISQPQHISGRIVSAVAVSDNRVWIGTEDGELNCMTLGDPDLHQVTIPGRRNKYRDILDDGDELWIATSGNGIFRYDIPSAKVTHHYTFASNSFSRQIITSGGNYLVASDDGVYIHERETDAFEKVLDTGSSAVLALLEDSRGTIWAGTSGKGIIQMDSTFSVSGVRKEGLRITSLFEDSRGRMWITTEGDGAYVIAADDSEESHITMADGLPTNITCSVAEDSEGMIWMATGNGLYMVDPNSFRIITSFHQRTHLEANEFTYDTACKSSADAIFMGTTDGLLSFSPSKMNAVDRSRAVYISSITGVVGRKFTELSSPGCSAMYSDRIVTSYRDVSSLFLRFSCPVYSGTLAYQYRYTLKSRHGTINRVTGENHATLTNIGYGKHVFTVSLVGSSDPESTRSVEIIVRPPFFKSLFAKLAAVLLLAFVALKGTVDVVKSRRDKRARSIRELEQAKQKELYESKNAFFTNITHEIRTPLSLIKMPLDNMIKSGEYSKRDLQVIQANTERLLNLTNQLLDIRKFEQNEAKLEFTRYNLCEIVRRTSALFNTMAEEQGVKMTVQVPENPVEAMCARDSVEKIISNLITNALKYGGNLISVMLDSSAGKAVLRVDSNGERISSRLSEKIFEKFIHGGKGTGLGLPLARALAEQHDGRLYLDTRRTDVNSFVLELPLEHPDSISLETTPERQTTDEEQAYSDSRKDVLIVEDNPDFRLYLAEMLSKDFNIFTATNGKAAVEKLEQKKVDLIISDVMMPVMDGCELCNFVKSEMEYSHIPVILLTAAVGMETRIETLEVGADGYIEKPFPVELLQATISNLFKNREIAYHQFSKSPLSHYKGAPANKVDEDFMSRLHNVMMDRIADSNLGINDLSAAMSISTSTLFRKIKANTGLNINEYIRISRLKRAAELLATGNYRVNEVADMVGFSSSSYFSSNFQKQFNMSPSAFMKKLDSQETGS